MTGELPADTIGCAPVACRGVWCQLRIMLGRDHGARRPQVPGEVRGILAAPDITTPALRALEAARLEFRRIEALPQVQEEALQPLLFQ